MYIHMYIHIYICIYIYIHTFIHVYTYTNPTYTNPTLSTSRNWPSACCVVNMARHWHTRLCFTRVFFWKTPITALNRSLPANNTATHCNNNTATHCDTLHMLS